MTIGSRIKEKRIERNLSQEELGKLVGVGKSTINKYELGVITGIPSDRIGRIAKALDTTPAYLMGWDDTDKTDLLQRKAEDDAIIDSYHAAPPEVQEAIRLILSKK